MSEYVKGVRPQHCRPEEHMAVPDPVPDAAAAPFWWEGRQEYWELPFFAEMDACCHGLAGTPDWNAAREQLWARREIALDEGDEFEPM